MSDSDIQIDEPPKAKKPKGGIPAIMLIMVIIGFVCYVSVLALQFMEYRYLRGASASETDIYAAEVVLPPA